MAKTNKFTLPENLEIETVEYINSVIAHLKKNEQFNVIDNGALRMLTSAYNTYVKAQKQLDIEGLTVTSDRGNIQPHPSYGIMKTSMAQAMDILRDFGLSLKSRSRLTIMSNDSEESPLMQFINENR